MPAIQGAINQTSLSENQLSSFYPVHPWRLNVGRPERWVSMLAGGALALFGMGRRSWPVRAAALAGGATLLYRGATGYCPGYGAFNVNRASRSGPPTAADEHSDTRQALGGARGIHVSATVTIDRPIAEVYRFWRNFENLPRFMGHLEAVAQREEGVSRWVAKGPGGMPVEWDARVINDVENKVIGWQSLDGSTISTAGSVNFRERGGGTEVYVHFQYEPPGGAVGAALARLFGKDPNQTVRHDLQQLKRILEGV